MQKQIEHLHKQLWRAREADHIVFLDDNGQPRAIPMIRLVGVYRGVSLENLQEDVLAVVKPCNRI